MARSRSTPVCTTLQTSGLTVSRQLQPISCTLIMYAVRGPAAVARELFRRRLTHDQLSILPLPLSLSGALDKCRKISNKSAS